MASTATKVLLGLGCGMLIGICLLMATCAGCATMVMQQAANRSVPVTDSASPVSNPIPYVVVRQWSVPAGGAGGRGRIIVVGESHRNEIDLRRLGEQFRTETPHSQFEFDEVYDSQKAASMRDAADKERLSRKRLAFYHRHKVMFYWRNPNTGLEELTLYPQGLDGRMTKINF